MTQDTLLGLKDARNGALPLSYDSDAFSNAAPFVSLTLKASPLQAVRHVRPSRSSSRRGRSPRSLRFAQTSVATLART